MNALPTATACALPHGQAHGIPRAIQSGSVAGTVHAKRSEVKGPEVKTPDLKGPEVKMNQPWSPSHHGVQKVDASDSAPVVAPSPVTTPDEMMSLAAIEHLDFEPTCDVPGCDRPAAIVVSVLPHLTHVAPEAQVGEIHTPCRPCWTAMIAPGDARCRCGAVVGWRDLWKIVEVLR